MDFEADLLATLPLLGEAATRKDLDKILARLRAERQWSTKGLPRTRILETVDDAFIHHRDHADRMMQGGDGFRRAKGIKKVTMQASVAECDIVIDGSREWDRRPHSYVSRIRFVNYGRIREAAGLSWLDRGRLLMGDNLMVDCNCDAFRYFYRYPATKRGFALVAEKRKARIRNPEGRGSVCKHLEHALKYLGANYAVIASAMKKHHQNLEESMSADKNISEALVCGHLHEDVAQFGILDVLRGLRAECAKKGMAKTANALLVAYGSASSEGAPAPASPTPATPDDRFRPAPKD